MERLEDYMTNTTKGTFGLDPYETHPNHEAAMAELLCELNLPNEPRVIRRILEAFRFFNLDHYKHTIPTNPLHEIFMAEARGYVMKKLAAERSLTEECHHWEEKTDLEVARWRRRMI